MTIGHTRRCSSFATSTNRKCKLPYSFMICNKKFCHIHAHIIFDKSAVIIQKCFIGWKLRQKMNNIFLKLPDDLQRKIMWYNREPYYLEKYHYKPIRNILNARYNQLSKDPYWKHETWSISFNIATTYYNQIISVYKLFNKYFSITLSKYDNLLFTSISRVRMTFLEDINNGIFSQKDKQWIDTMKKNLKNSLNEFYVKYENRYITQKF